MCLACYSVPHAGGMALIGAGRGGLGVLTAGADDGGEGIAALAFLVIRVEARETEPELDGFDSSGEGAGSSGLKAATVASSTCHGSERMENTFAGISRFSCM